MGELVCLYDVRRLTLLYSLTSTVHWYWHLQYHPSHGLLDRANRARQTKVKSTYLREDRYVLFKAHRNGQYRSRQTKS